MFLNPLNNYDTKHYFPHHHSQRFIYRFLVLNPSLIRISVQPSFTCPSILHSKNKILSIIFIFFVKIWWNIGYAPHLKDGIGRHSYSMESPNIRFSDLFPSLIVTVVAPRLSNYLPVKPWFPNLFFPSFIYKTHPYEKTTFHHSIISFSLLIVFHEPVGFRRPYK